MNKNESWLIVLCGIALPPLSKVKCVSVCQCSMNHLMLVEALTVRISMSMMSCDVTLYVMSGPLIPAPQVFFITAPKINFAYS